MEREPALLFYCHLDPREIYLLRFLLEGYDGLTTVTTMSAVDGLVCCLVPDDQEVNLCQLFEDFSADGLIYSFVRVNAPELRRCLFNRIQGGLDARN